MAEAKVVGINGMGINVPNMNDIANGINDAKEEFIKIVNDKSKWAALFLFAVSFFLIWVIIYYIYSKLSLESYNNKRINAFYKSLGGSKIAEISTCNDTPDKEGKYICEGGMHTDLLYKLRPKLRDFYVMSSYNSCCGGNTKKDWVSMKPLEQVIIQGARFLDFEIYSKNGTPIIAAGGDANPNTGKYCLKGTYNQLDFNEVMNRISVIAFSAPSNKHDPLILNFRIKTNNKGVYDKMYETINNTFGTKSTINRLLPEELRFDGQYPNKTNKDYSISNVPLHLLKNKIIISVKDSNHGYVNKKFKELISMSDKSKAGNGMPYVHSYKNIEVKDAYDPEELITENKQYLGITYPDFTNNASNSSAALHHKLGFQFVTMNFHIIDEHLRYYINFFNDSGSAFVLKPVELRHKPVRINKPAEAPKELSFEQKEASILNGAGKLVL